MLGDLAFQSSAAVTVDDLTVDGHFTGAVGKPMPVNGPTMRFDGVDDEVSFAATTDSPFSFTNGTDDTPFSVSAWVKMADAQYFGILSKNGSTNSLKEWFLWTNASNVLQLWLRDTSGNYVIIPLTGNLNDYVNEWTHISVSYGGAGPNSSVGFASAGSSVNFYINGKIATKGTVTYSGTYLGMSATAQPLTIGSVGGVWAEGEIRDVKLYNKELSLAEIREVYSNGQLPESFAESTGSADVVTNGGFENWHTSTDLVGWTEKANITVQQEATDKITGSYSCRLNGAGTLAATNGNWLEQSTVVGKGKKCRFTGKFKKVSGSGDLQVGIRYGAFLIFNGSTFSTWVASGYTSGTEIISQKSLGNGWYSVVVDFVNESSASDLAIAAASGVPYLIDDVSLVQIGAVLDARAEQFDTSTGKLYDLSGNSFVGTQSGGVSLLGREMPIYQTGTWTVGLEFGGTALAVASQTGTWTRIGDLVHIAGAFNLSSIAGIGSGNARITGLPFTAEAQTSRHGITFVLTVGMTGLTSAVVGNVLGGDTDIAIYQWGSTGTASLTNANFTASTYSRFSGFYQIS